MDALSQVCVHGVWSDESVCELCYLEAEEKLRHRVAELAAEVASLKQWIADEKASGHHSGCRVNKKRLQDEIARLRNQLNSERKLYKETVESLRKGGQQ